MTRSKSCCLSAVAASAALVILVAAGVSVAAPDPPVVAAEDRTTELISRTPDGRAPNGQSLHGVISGDRRYARLIAYESDASNLVDGDTNGMRDVFAVRRTGTIDNTGGRWRGGAAILVSRGVGGAPANGPSARPSVSGDFAHDGKCVAFVSSASNLVEGDTNGVVDAFLATSPGSPVKRVSLIDGKQVKDHVTAVTVSGDCSRVSFVTGGRLYTRAGSKTYKVSSYRGDATDPAYATGDSRDVVFAGDDGIYISPSGTGAADRVASGGRNPVFNDLKRQTIAYEKDRNGTTQIYYRDVGESARIISSFDGDAGNRASREPVIGNSGYYVTFESDATNLSVSASGTTGDSNGRTDSYLFTDVRDLTLVQSVAAQAVPLPGGGQNPSMSYYANYILFDSPAPIGSVDRPHQVWMRWLGEV